MGSDLQTTPRRPRSALHPYQARAVQFLVEHPEAGLFMDPGLGKSITTLTAIADLKTAGAVRRVLVVGPPRVVATVWAREADLWEHTAHLRVLALTGTAEQRREALRTHLAEIDVVCVSYGLLAWLHRTVKREVWDWVVMDECFPAGTLVNTPSGAVPIEKIAPGTVVESTDGPRRVTRVKTGRSEVLVEIVLQNGTVLRCTPNHPFFTNEGWICAGNLTKRHSLYDPENVRTLLKTVRDEEETSAVLQPQLWDHPDPRGEEVAGTNQDLHSMREDFRGSPLGLGQNGLLLGVPPEAAEGPESVSGVRTDPNLRRVRGGVPSGGEGQQTTILQTILLSEVADAGTGDQGQGLLCRSEGEGCPSAKRAEDRETCLEPWTPLASRASSKNESGSQAARSTPESAWRERAAAALAGAEVADRIAPARGDRVRHLLGRTAARLSNLLQGRHRSGGGEDRYRGRRPGSLFAETVGREEGCQADGTRVAGVTYCQLGSPCDVYSLEVEGCPHFFAGGYLVHNSSLIKNHATKRWKGVAYTALTAKRRTILTGTPTPKSLADLWAQVTVADLGKRFGRSPYTFLGRYFMQTATGWVPKPHSRPELIDKLKDFAVALRAKDYLDLPALIETTVPVEMPASAWAVYAELAESFQAELADGLVVDVANAGVMAGKLQQVCQGALFTDEHGTWSELHRAKLEAVEELVSELGGEPCLIAYWFKHDLARLRELFPDAPVLGSSLSQTRLNDLIDRWNRGTLPVLLIHPASAGHGLNLQAGGRHLIWLALPWSWELWTQTVARLYRQGQTKPVMVYRVVALGTIDERILGVLADRQGGHEALIAALKAEVKEAVFRGDRLKEARAAMQRAHPDHGGTVEAFIAARRRFEEEKRQAA